jgi:hypothetical protein
LLEVTALTGAVEAEGVKAEGDSKEVSGVRGAVGVLGGGASFKVRRMRPRRLSGV